MKNYHRFNRKFIVILLYFACTQSEEATEDFLLMRVFSLNKKLFHYFELFS